MGRPTKADDDKRKVLGFRMSPADRHKVEASAKRTGRSIPAEIEHRILATIDLDDTGLDLVIELARAIATVEQKQHGSPWHSSLELWAATKELFRLGVIDQFCPSRWQEDPEANEAYNDWQSVVREREAVIARLAEFGFTITDTPQRSSVGRPRGIFGSRTGGTLGSLLLPADGGRNMARRMAEEAPASPERTEALALLDRLARLDDSEAEKREEWASQLRNFWNDEKAGRDMARAILHFEARAKLDRGEEPNAVHLMNVWPD